MGTCLLAAEAQVAHVKQEAEHPVPGRSVREGPWPLPGRDAGGVHANAKALGRPQTLGE